MRPGVDGWGWRGRPGVRVGVERASRGEGWEWGGGPGGIFAKSGRVYT